MKLYTEEQVNKILEELKKAFLPENIECDGAHCMGCWKDVVRGTIQMVNSSTPIKLPSDEEIEKEWNDVRLEQYYIDGAIDGAKWMKEQIVKANDSATYRT